MGSDKRKFLIEHLERSQSGLETTLENVDAVLWTYKPSPDEWSIAQCAEHIVMVETAVANRVATYSGKPPEHFDQTESERKDEIVLRAANRTSKVQAPSSMLPTDRYKSPTALLADFRNAHSQLLKIASDFPEWLRGRFTEHMVFKKLDGYQWLLVSSCHTMRHTLQIMELKRSRVA